MTQASRTAAKRDRSRTIEKLAPIALIAPLMISSSVWIVRDQHVWPWDQAWYGEVALDLWYARLDGVKAWAIGMVHAFGSKPPLISWVGQFFLPLSRITGETESAFLLLNVAAAIATLAIVYSISRRLGASVLGALAGVAACGGASLFIGLTHEFMVELIQALTAAGMIFVAWNATRVSLLRTCGLAALVTALSFLTKASSGTFILPLLIYISLGLGLTRTRKRSVSNTTLVDVLIAAVAFIAIVIAMIWYMANWRPMVQHVIDATNTDVTSYYGSMGSIPAKMQFWTSALSEAFSPFSALADSILTLIVVAIIVGLVRVIKKPAREWPQHIVDTATLLNLTLFGIVVATLLAYSMQPNEETRYLLPLFPIIGVLVAWSLTALGSAPINGILFIALAGNAVIGHAYAHGWDPLGIKPSPWLHPVVLDTRDKLLLTRAVQLTCGKANANHYSIIGVEYPTFNANSAAFYTAKDRRRTGYRCYYTSLGYAEADTRRAMVRISQINPDFIVTMPIPKLMSVPSDVFNRVSLSVAEGLAADPHFMIAPGSDNDLLIYQRRSP